MISKQTILSLLDYTSLGDKDSDESIRAFLADAESYRPAAICVYPQFIHLAKEFKTATVVNFPLGNSSPEKIKSQVEFSLDQTVDEIDVVWDFDAYNAGNKEKAVQPIKTVLSTIADKATRPIGLKVILETSALRDVESACKLVIQTIRQAACPHLGRVFLKTSTGKHQSGGATIQAAKGILNAIKQEQVDYGIKISGGVSKLDAAIEYLELIQTVLPLTPDYVRIGSSGLMKALI